MTLPPGPRAPAAWQTWAWVARPTDFLRRAQATYGEPFTVRTAWQDAPLVVVSDPAEVKRAFAAGPDELRGGASAAFLEPFAGPTSILITHGEAHLRRRKLVLPAFHGDRLRRWQGAIARLAEAELDGWDGPVRTHARMQALTFEVIARVVLGAGDDPRLRVAIRTALDMTASMPRLVAMGLVQRPLGGLSPYGRFLRAVERVDEQMAALIAGPVDPDSVLAMLIAARHEDGTPPTHQELRDQLVTLLAAGHETTATALAWAFERLARHPEALGALRDGDGDDARLDATVKETLRVRPVLTVAPRQVVRPYDVGGHTLPPGVHLAPSIYLVHRRPELWPEPTAFRPERFLDGAVAPLAWIPFGGGVRRCAGAAFAALEMREVLRAAAARVTLTPDRRAGERMVRRGVTLAPLNGGMVRAAPLRSRAAPCPPSAVTTA